MVYAYNFDVIFISYDEPNADENWKYLQSIIGHGKRVHGIKGIDAAHKEAARIAYSDHFFIIDGDSRPHEYFFGQELDNLNPNYVYSWPAINSVNGLMYGNGGAKLWPKHTMINMKSHEETGGTDFCWSIPYFQMDKSHSTTHCNITSYQAFRTGFREGVRLCLNQGAKQSSLDFIPKVNYSRLLTWLTVGRHTPNGEWCMHGARLGCYLANCTNLDISLISDYKWFEKNWEGDWKKRTPKQCIELGIKLCNTLGIEIIELDEKQSKFTKTLLHNPPRHGLMIPQLGDELYLKKIGLWKNV